MIVYAVRHWKKSNPAVKNIGETFLNEKRAKKWARDMNNFNNASAEESNKLEYDVIKLPVIELGDPD